jgi:hypothetical protein
MQAFFIKVLFLINKYKPDVILWEDLKTNQNPDVIRDLGKMDGILQYICEEWNYNYNKYIPISIRAKVCINKTITTTKTGKKVKKATKLDLAETICSLYPEWGLVIPYDKIVKVHTRGKNKGQEYVDDDCEFLNVTDSIGIGLYYFKYGEGKKVGYN